MTKWQPLKRCLQNPAQYPNTADEMFTCGALCTSRWVNSIEILAYIYSGQKQAGTKENQAQKRNRHISLTYSKKCYMIQDEEIEKKSLKSDLSPRVGIIRQSFHLLRMSEYCIGVPLLWLNYNNQITFRLCHYRTDQAQLKQWSSRKLSLLTQKFTQLLQDLSYHFKTKDAGPYDCRPSCMAFLNL